MKRFFAPMIVDANGTQKNQVIHIESGKINAITPGNIDDADVVLKGTVCPGFIDVQVNGGGGVLFNNAPTLETLVAMSEAHQRFGTTAMLPTVITDDYDVMQRAATATSEAIQLGVAGITGIHFEGPHLSKAKRGIHPSEKIRSLSEQEFALFSRKDLGIVCVTIAPETVPPSDIQRLTDLGVIVCIGHSNANYEQTMQALTAGATGFTHLFNAMSPLQSREAGVTGCALLNDNSFAGLIVDLHHVCAQTCALAIKTKGYQRIMLVTDSMSHVGSEQDRLDFAGMTIYKDKGKLSLQDGTLAGSALSMAGAIQNTVHILNIPLHEASAMASTSPASFLGISKNKGKIESGFDADFVCLNEGLSVTSTYIAGKRVFAH